MTGSLQIKQNAAGKDFYYVKVAYKDPLSGKWQSKTRATGLEVKNNKRKADIIKNEVMQELSYLEDIPNGIDNVIKPDILFCDYLDGWLEDKKMDLKKSTFEGYAYRVKRIKEYFEPMGLRLIDITPKVLDTFYKYCLKYGKVNQNTHEREPLAVRSVRSYKSILHAAFIQGCIDGIISSNPTIGIAVHGKRNSDYSEEYLFLTEEEISDLLHFLGENYPRLLPIAFVGCYYGLRRSEILGLKWSAIDFNKMLIHICHTVVRVKTIDEADQVKTKDSKRSLNLFETARKCFSTVKEEQQGYKKFFGSEYQNKEDYVFTWEDGRCYDPNYLTSAFGKATRAFGRPEITLHKLRHSCASMLISRGWDIKKVQYWLGHTDTQTTLNIYAHFNKHQINACENDLSEISMVAANLF